MTLAPDADELAESSHPNETPRGRTRTRVFRQRRTTSGDRETPRGDGCRPPSAEAAHQPAGLRLGTRGVPPLHPAPKGLPPYPRRRSGSSNATRSRFASRRGLTSRPVSTWPSSCTRTATGASNASLRLRSSGDGCMHSTGSSNSNTGRIRDRLCSSPTAGPPPSTIDAMTSDHESHGTVLFVDDDTTALETYSNFLQASGYRVLTAVDAQTALALAEGARPTR